MNRDEIVRDILPLVQELRKSGIAGLFIFGSRARGDNRQDSDLDLFIDYSVNSKVPSYFKLLEMQSLIENRVGIPVHLGTRASLDPAIRPSVEREAVRVF